MLKYNSLIIISTLDAKPEQHPTIWPSGFYFPLGDVQKLRLHIGGRGGQLRAILCKLLWLEVYILRGGGVQKSRKYANVVYVRPLTQAGVMQWLDSPMIT